jgi:hypothetical protein
MDAKPDWVRRVMIPAVAASAFAGLLAGAWVGYWDPIPINASNMWERIRDFALIGMLLGGFSMWWVTWFMWLVRRVRD